MIKFLLLLSTSLIIFACTNKSVDSNADPKPKVIPIPAQVYHNMENEKEFEANRDAYFDLIHSGSTPYDWRAINKENFNLLAQKRMNMLESRAFESFVEGRIDAEWKERGSIDVPGNIRICDYHPQTNDIYVVSDGGILWKGNIDGENWTPLNDNIQFDRDVIQVVNLEDGGTRIIVAKGYGLQYSDDEGATWTVSEGLSGATGKGINLVELNDANMTLVYLYNRVNVISGANQNRIAYSTDHGATFTFVDNLMNSGSNFASMDVPDNESKAYIFDGNDAIYSFEGTSLSLISSDLDLDGSSRVMIRANKVGASTTIYVLMDSYKLYKSVDNGLTFAAIAELPSSAWEVGFQVSIDNPNILYYGDIELHRSTDGGLTWNTVSAWWEYYGDVENKIHADIMSIEPYKTLDGSEITLIPNHGGISISWDQLLNTPNIAMATLNTGQFYDVLTSPLNSNIIFGGTQDQGFQRTISGDSPEPSSFQQIISGDYGEMQLSNNDQAIWIQYPGADFQIYPNANTDEGYTYTFNLDGTNMPNVNWIVPTGAAPNKTDNFIYVGGGNLDGGSGSYLVKLSLEDWGIAASQYDFDFRAASGASISAIETTPLNDQLIYVVTENGRFFYSEDAGESFTMTEDYIGPSGGWIYTADIYASRITPGLLFVGGSGYAGNAVYFSTDSARTFQPLAGDMPNTMVHEMAMDDTEQYLFAASDIGPYAYSMELEEWYNISGISAPLQQYISVEYVADINAVRFATWGRGIWDFNMKDVSGIETNPYADFKVNVYPNPCIAGQEITIETNKKGVIRIYSLDGKFIQTKILQNGIQKINTNNIPKGTYLLLIDAEDNKKIQPKKIIIS